MTAAQAPAGAPAFQLTDEQHELRRTVKAFTDKRIAPHAGQWDRDHHLPLDVLIAAAELGLGGITVDPSREGSGLSRLESAIVFEALATGCPTIAAYVSIHNMVASMVDRYGTVDQRRDWLPGLTSFTTLGSYCLTEPGSGSDAAALTTRARQDGSDYVIDGAKQFVSGAGVAGLYLVMARTGESGPRGISAFLVDGAADGLHIGVEEDKLGWRAQPTRAVQFDGVRVSATQRLGDEGRGFPIALSGLDGGRLNIAACSLGGAQAALDKALAYTTDREAFGRRLSQLPTIRFTLADMHTELEAARALVWRAAAAHDAGDPDATALCAMAKRFTTDVCLAIADRSLQLHGGYGCFGEYGVEKLVRDLRVHQIVEGTNEIMRVVIARDLIGGADR